jgi:DNA-binding HxlR family transcriptional regulator
MRFLGWQSGSAGASAGYALRSKEMSKGVFRSDCPIASALDLLGDKWTLLIFRDMAFGKRRFSEFLESSEQIQRNILSDRLKRMEAGGLVRKARYQTRPARYEYRLTARGADLLPIVQNLARWGYRHIRHTYAPPPELLARTPEALAN